MNTRPFPSFERWMMRICAHNWRRNGSPEQLERAKEWRNLDAQKPRRLLMLGHPCTEARLRERYLDREAMQGSWDIGRDDHARTTIQHIVVVDDMRHMSDELVALMTGLGPSRLQVMTREEFHQMPGEITAFSPALRFGKTAILEELESTQSKLRRIADEIPTKQVMDEIETPKIRHLYPKDWRRPPTHEMRARRKAERARKRRNRR